jgi:hypothetical protein
MLLKSDVFDHGNFTRLDFLAVLAISPLETIKFGSYQFGNIVFLKIFKFEVLHGTTTLRTKFPQLASSVFS